MHGASRIMAATVAFSVLASPMGSMASEAERNAPGVPEAHPRFNGDGNYNIISILTDQEHHFEEYPEGTAYEARKLLAEMGTTFEKHYICATMSTSSRSVIYTGRHITHTKMIDNTDFDWQGSLSNNIVTLGDRLRSADYYTAYKGKWHMANINTPLRTEEDVTDLEEYGFADWGIGGDYVSAKWEGHEIDPEIHGDTVEWLQETGVPLNDAGQSFYLAVNLVNPHDIMYFNTDETFQGPIEVGGAPDDPLYDTTYDTPIPDSWNQDLDDPSYPDALRIFRRFGRTLAGPVTTREGWKEFQDYYFNCIQDSERHLQGILQTLEDLDMLDNTIILFTSDHGEMGGTHGLKGKGGVMYENNIHVPLIIYHPEYPGGRSVSAVTSHIDLAPTLLHMTNISEAEKAAVTEGLPGKNLMELVAGTADSVREGALFCCELISATMARGHRDAQGNILYYTFDPDIRGFVRGVATERYKFARYFSTEFNSPATLEEILENNDIELYDLENDPQELVNLAADPQAHEELILQLNNLLNQLIAEEIGVDDGEEVSSALQDYEARLHPKNSGCSLGGHTAWMALLVFPGMFLLLRRGGRRK
ncbi:MAG TPA: sulfatase-like hydrolase/transferase [Synergistaceae bacterium]|nr:sulfatase-like hydrolase/transferase [Synergistaceae bacterium]